MQNGTLEDFPVRCETSPMAGIHKEPGPVARRIAENIRRFRREAGLTTGEVSRRLGVLGHPPVPPASVTKAEQAARRTDADDLVAFALALGVTPNSLLLPADPEAAGGHKLTPGVSGTATGLWEWAQGEVPLPAGPAAEWAGQGRRGALEFSLRTRPYLRSARNAARDVFNPGLHGLALAVLGALASGATPAQVRRVVELYILLPVVLPDGELADHVTELREREGNSD
jgi:transcriptional regulator with XRE-family HTH domain